MVVAIPPGDGPVRWIRRLARGIGSTIAGIWLLVGALHGIGGPEPWTWESTGITALVAASALGVLIAWRKEAIGGIVLVTVAMVFSAFAWVTAGHNEGFAMLISGGPFLLAGSLFLVSEGMTRKQVATWVGHHTGKDGNYDQVPLARGSWH
jgi:hypothetical protein